MPGKFTASLYNMAECAVGADGMLKDSSEIEWFNDVDDDKPISAPPANKTSALSSLHPFFTSSRAPAAFVAGSCHSACVPRPSTKVLDPDNAKGSSSKTTMKHKVMNDMCTVAKHQLVSIDTAFNYDNGSDDNTNSSMNVGGGNTDPEDDPEVAYASTKMMGDADHEVNYMKLTFRDIT